jgi:hypothetical protein
VDKLAYMAGLLEEKMQEPTKAMVELYEKRTREHIERVRRNCETLAGSGLLVPQCRQRLVERGRVHDASKYGEAERGPYIWITEFYRCKNAGIPFTYPPGVEKITRAASGLHVHNPDNGHHPEAHGDPTVMDDVDLAEMVCDWHAMSQEVGGTTRGWADRNIGTKWTFTPEQAARIYEFIEFFESVE